MTLLILEAMMFVASLLIVFTDPSPYWKFYCAIQALVLLIMMGDRVIKPLDDVITSDVTFNITESNTSIGTEFPHEAHLGDVHFLDKGCDTIVYEYDGSSWVELKE